MAFPSIPANLYTIMEEGEEGEGLQDGIRRFLPARLHSSCSSSSLLLSVSWASAYLAAAYLALSRALSLVRALSLEAINRQGRTPLRPEHRMCMSMSRRVYVETESGTPRLSNLPLSRLIVSRSSCRVVCVCACVSQALAAQETDS